MSVTREPHDANEKTTYSLDWEELPFVTSPPKMLQGFERPDCLDELLGFASNVASEFVFVRVDFYLLSSANWKFSELTFTPASGVCAWTPKEYDRILGDRLRIDFDADGR